MSIKIVSISVSAHAYLEVPHEIWLGVVTCEVVVEEAPIGLALDSLASFPQHDRFRLVIFLLGETRGR